MKVHLFKIKGKIMTNNLADRAFKSKKHKTSVPIRKIIESSSAFGSLALYINHVDVDDYIYAYNDGKTIYTGTKYDELNLKEKCFVTAHNIMHIIFCHAERMNKLMDTVGFSKEVWEFCADAIINETLNQHAIFKLLDDVPKLTDALNDYLNINLQPKEALRDWNTERLYKEIMKVLEQDKNEDDQNQNSSGGGNGGAQGKSGKQNAKESIQDKNPLKGDIKVPQRMSPDEIEKNIRQWNRHIQQSIAGDEAGGILRSITAEIPVSKTPWEHTLRNLVLRSVQKQVDISYSRPSRRWIATQGLYEHETPFEPGLSNERPKARIVLMFDTSGSIDEKLFHQFASEMITIQRQTGCDMTVIVADAAVHGIWEVKQDENALNKVQFLGHGGTNFDPAIKEAIDLKPDIGIYLTDLMGPATIKPPFPFIWAVPKEFEGEAKAPFGNLLIIE